jgi:hypothetical protein
MTVLHAAGDIPTLLGQDGELISVRVAVEPKLLEDLLEALASLDFPVNPQLYHHTGSTTVEFPAYSTQLEKIRGALRRQGFDASNITHAGVLSRTQNA